MAKVYRWSLLGQSPASSGILWVCNLHYQTDVPILGSEPSVSLVLNEIDQHFSSSGTNLSKWSSLVDNGSKLLETRLYEEVDPNSGDAPAGTINSYSITGTGNSAGSDVLPAAASIYISLTTDKLGKSFRGGVHCPPVRRATDLASDGTWDTGSSHFGFATALATAIEDVIDNVFDTTGDIKPVIYSRTRRARGLDDFANDISGSRVRPDVRWLRRRMVGHGT